MISIFVNPGENYALLVVKTSKNVPYQDDNTVGYHEGKFAE